MKLLTHLDDKERGKLIELILVQQGKTCGNLWSYWYQIWFAGE